MQAAERNQAARSPRLYDKSIFALLEGKAWEPGWIRDGVPRCYLRTSFEAVDDACICSGGWGYIVEYPIASP